MPANLPSAFQSLRLVEQLTVAGLLLSSLQMLTNYTLYRTNGLLDWNILKIKYRPLVHKKLDVFRDHVFGFKGTIVIIAARAVCCLLLFFHFEILVYQIVLLAALIFINFCFVRRSTYGHNSADDLMNVNATAILISLAAQSEQWRICCLWFICLHLFIAYSAAGFSKISKRGWYAGKYLPLVLSTQTYGHQRLYVLLTRSKTLAKILTWGMLIFECLFPLILFFPKDLTTAFLIVGILFHLSIAIVMGLNTFLWAFVAGYPAIYFCKAHIG